MPRNPSGVYSLPAGSIVALGEDILPSQHNTPLNDIASDLNAARPITAGGTGATTASAALVNFGLTASAAEINVLDGVTVNTAQLNSIVQFSGRNLIINGNFDIWQQATSGSSGYVADQWATFRAGSTAAISQQPFALGQTDVPGEPRFFHRVAVTSVAGAGNFAFLTQPVESVRTLAGQTATVSFWAKADAAKNITVEFRQDFGSGGSPSADVTGIEATTIALTTSWKKFTVTVAIPSISGKTIGTNNDGFLGCQFWFDAGSDWNARSNNLGQQSGTFDIAKVQLEAGSIATPFEYRSYGQELALCQRYSEVITLQAYGLLGTYSGLGFNGAAEGFLSQVIPFSTIKRTSPSITILGPANGPWAIPYVTPVSASGAHSFIGVANPFGVRFMSNRLVGGATPIAANVYAWEGSLTFLASSRF